MGDRKLFDQALRSLDKFIAEQEDEPAPAAPAAVDSSDDEPRTPDPS